METSGMQRQGSCWGTYEVEPESLAHWRIGPLDLWVRRTATDWRYAAQCLGDPLDNTLRIEVPYDELDNPDGHPDESARFGCRQTEPRIELLPLLADRPVVARPAVPFFVPIGEELELYVSTPIWVQLRSGKTELVELPCIRPSDTWFGTNTHGELNYATKTHLRRNLENMVHRPHRAVTCLSIVNASSEQLAIPRLSIPVPQLSLFEAVDGTLWTQRVELRWEDEGDLTRVVLGQEAPEEAGGGRLLADPRTPLGRSFGSLVFGGLFDSGIL